MGAGMGRLGHVCGAVSSAYLLLGLKYGSSIPNDKETKEKIYTLVYEFSKKFEERNNSTLCRELLGVDFLTGDRSVIAEKTKSICPKVIQDAAEILEEMLS